MSTSSDLHEPIGSSSTTPDPSDRTMYLIGVGVIAAGSAALLASQLAGGLFWVVASAALIGGGVWLTFHGLPKLNGYRTKPEKLPVGRLAIWASIAIIAGVLGIVLAHPITVSLVTFAASMVVAPLALTMRRHSVQGTAAWLWLGAGIVTYVAGGAIAATGAPATGTAVLLVGLVLFRVGVLPVAGDDGRVGLALGLALGAMAVGIGLVGFAVRYTEIVPGVIGVGLIFPALIALAVAVPQAEYGPVDDTSFAAIGGLTAIAAVFIFWSTGVGDLLSWVLAAAFFCVGLALGRSGEIVVVGLVLAMVVGWASVERPTETFDPIDRAESSGRIVAVGDSYISGEGADEYFAGTNNAGPDRNECRRAPTAYSVLVAEDLGHTLDFFACSGAKTGDLLLRTDPDDLVGQMPDSPADLPGALVQLEYLRRLEAELDEGEDVDLVLVSIGGNDAGFSEIAQGCLLPGTCTELSNLWLGNIETIGPSVRAVYRQIKEIVDDDVPVVAMPYPMMLRGEPCGWGLLDDDEHDFLVEFVTRLNQQIQVSAAQEGVHYFADGLVALDGARICDGDVPEASSMNLIRLETPNGDLGASLTPGSWIHNSMHPTADGHERTAAALAPFLADLLATDAPNPEPNPAAALEIGSIRATHPFVIEDAVLTEIRERAPDACKEMVPNAFGDRVLLVDRPDEDGEGRRAPSFVLADAAPGIVCFKQGDGTWRLTVPESADPAAADEQDAEVGSPILRENGVVSVQPSVPEDGGRLMVLYRRLDGTPQLRAVDFCSELDTCPSSVSEWTNQQLALTARASAAPVVIAILAGWFTIVGLAPRRPEVGEDDEPNPDALISRIWAKVRG